MPFASEVDAEQRLSIRAHYITGHFDREEALVRIENGGFTQLTREQAIEVLTAPIKPTEVYAWTGRNVTDKQIALRLAKVKA